MTFFYDPRSRVTALLLSSLIIIDMATDIFIPALPDIAVFFKVDEEITKYTVSLNLIGIALSSLLYGPLADHFGRRPILLAGTLIFTLASLLCALAPNIETLLGARFVMGLGGGAACVISLAGVNDLYEERQKARVLAITGIVLALSPGIAPLFGGYISAYLNWQGVFYALFFAALIVLFLLFVFMPETLKTKSIGPMSIRNAFSNYLKITTNFGYMGYALLYAFSTSVIWIEVSEIPFVYIETYGVLEQHYGYFSASGIIVYILGMFVNRYLLSKYKINQLILFGLITTLLSFILLYLLSLIFPLNPYVIRFIMFLSAFGLAFLFSNSITRALNEAPQMAGTASALIGPFDMLTGALMITIVGEFYDGTIKPYALTGLITLSIWLVLFILLRRKQHADDARNLKNETKNKT